MTYFFFSFCCWLFNIQKAVKVSELVLCNLTFFSVFLFLCELLSFFLSSSIIWVNFKWHYRLHYQLFRNDIQGFSVWFLVNRRFLIWICVFFLYCETSYFRWCFGWLLDRTLLWSHWLLIWRFPFGCIGLRNFLIFWLIRKKILVGDWPGNFQKSINFKNFERVIMQIKTNIWFFEFLKKWNCCQLSFSESPRLDVWDQ